MDPYSQQPQQQPQPQPELSPQPLQPEPAIVAPTTGPKKMSRRTKVALWLMIGPTALLIVTFVLYATLNYIFGVTPEVTTTTTTESGDLFVETSNPAGNGANIANILMFLVGAIATLTWLPGLIIGSVLLATKKK